MKVLKVALTGGPCGGKTTSIKTIEEEFTERGYHVIIVPEAATILINSGIRPFGKNGLSLYDFQKYVMNLQLYLESVAEQAAAEIDAPSIIICDRGLMDDKAYVTEEEFKKLMKEIGTTQFDLFNRYDLVMHLVTAADGKEEFYTTANNEARTETPEEAIEKDKKTLAAWLGHDNLKIMGNDTDFETKIAKTVREIYNLLKNPYPVQKQEKYLVTDIDVDKLLETSPVLIEIEQYFSLIEGGDVIYRKSRCNGETKYTKITKLDTAENKERIIKKKNITEEEYLSNFTDDITPIRKKRYCFSYLNQYFRLDLFEDGLKLLEIEETNKTRERKLPDFIQVSDEVTDNVDYRNAAIFNRLNKEKSQTKKKC